MKTIVCTLVVAFVLGGIGVLYAQAQTSALASTNHEQLERNQPIIDNVDVMQRDIGELQTDVSEIKSILEKQDEKQDDILDAIRELK